MLIYYKSQHCETLIHSKLIYKFNAIPIKISIGIFFLWNLEILIVKFIWKSDKPKIATLLLENSKMEDFSYQISGPFLELQ